MQEKARQTQGSFAVTTLLSGSRLKNLSEVFFFRQGEGKKKKEKKRKGEKIKKKSERKKKSLALAVGRITVNTGDPSTLIAVLTQ